MRFDFDDETVKYRKKKGKNKPRTPKANHKHEYEEVLVKTFINSHDHYYLGKACIHCGKVEDVNFFITERTSDFTHRMLKSDEILEKYKHLRIVNKKF